MTDQARQTRQAHEGEVDEATARKSALLVACVLLLMAAWNYHRGRMTVVGVLGGIGGTLLLVGLLLPSAAKIFHAYWMRLAAVLGYINSRVLLFVLFYGLLTPYGFISRLAGRDKLNRRSRSRDSYWIPRERTRQGREQFERLF